MSKSKTEGNTLPALGAGKGDSHVSPPRTGSPTAEPHALQSPSHRTMKNGESSTLPHVDPSFSPSPSGNSSSKAKENEKVADATKPKGMKRRASTSSNDASPPSKREMSTSSTSGKGATIPSPPNKADAPKAGFAPDASDEWADVYAQNKDRRGSGSGAALTSFKRGTHRRSSVTSTGTGGGKSGGRRASFGGGSGSGKEDSGCPLKGGEAKAGDSPRGGVVLRRRSFGTGQDGKTFDSNFGPKRSVVDFNMDAKQRAKFTKALDDEQKKLLETDLEKNDKYKWKHDLVTTPFSVRANFNKSFLTAVQEAYPGTKGIPKIMDPKLTPPTMHKALVVSCGVYQNATIASYPQATKDGINLVEVLNHIGFEVTHLSTLPLETRVQRRLEQRAKAEAALANSNLKKSTTVGGDESSSPLLEPGDDPLGVFGEEEKNHEAPLEDCHTESDKDDDDQQQQQQQQQEEEVNNPGSPIFAASMESESEMDLSPKELEQLPTKINIMRELSKHCKLHKNNILASNVVIFVGRTNGNAVNVNEYSCVHPVKLFTCYDSDPHRNASYFPVEVLSAMKMERTLTVADLAPTYPNPGIGWVHSDAETGGHLEFQYPTALSGFNELLGPRAGMLSSLVIRGMRGKAARDLHLTPNNLNVFIGWRLMYMGWKFYTSATPLQTGVYDMATRTNLYEARKDMRSFSHAKWKMWSSFRLFGLVGDSLSKDFSTVSNQLLYKIHNSKSIHFGTDDKVAISSMLTDGRMFLVFKTPDSLLKQAASFEMYLPPKIPGGTTTIVRQLTQMRLEVTFPKPSLNQAVKAAKEWISEKTLGAHCRLFCGVEVCLQTSRRGERKLDWAMRAGYFAPLLHVELMEIDRTTQMRGRLHCTIQIQAWYRRYYCQSRFKKAQKVVLEYHSNADKLMKEWQAQWKVYNDAFWARLTKHAEKVEQEVRPEMFAYEADFFLDIADYRCKTWSQMILDSRGRYFAVRPLRVLQRRGSNAGGAGGQFNLATGFTFFKEDYMRDINNVEDDSHPLGPLSQKLPADLVTWQQEHSPFQDKRAPSPLDTSASPQPTGPLTPQPTPLASPLPSSGSLSLSTSVGGALAQSTSASPEREPLPPFSIIRSRAEIANHEYQSFFFLMLEFDRKLVELRQERFFAVWSGHLKIPFEVEHSVEHICADQHMELLKIVSAVRRFIVIPTNRVNKDPYVLRW